LADFVRHVDLLECVSCGLCLEVCPIYGIRRDEPSGPRGRIRLMDLLARADHDPGVWRIHLDECIGCLACQARCPSGIPYGGMLDRARQQLEQTDPPAGLTGLMARLALDHLLPQPARLRRLRLPLWLLQISGLLWLIRKLGLARARWGRWLTGLHWVPRIKLLRGKVPAPVPGAPFVLFRGCLGGLLFPSEEGAAMRLLGSQGGYTVTGQETCCGAVHRHLGRLEEACELARRNIMAFEKMPGEIVSHSAGCCAALKEYGHWLEGDPDWAQRAARFSARVRDLSEVLTTEHLVTGPGEFAGLRVALDDACHAVHAQGLAAGPRRLLDAVPDLERVELPRAERCCGAGGTYFLRHPQLSRELIQGKIADLESCRADLLLTANPGCRLQWGAALRDAGSSVKVVHPAEIWARALGKGEGGGGS
jgi:glycolate oxidase iron-sulfur subunit